MRTLLIELTTDEQLREWLPKLVGIEFHVAFELPDGVMVYGRPSDADEKRLTRDDTTAAVHYLNFEFSPEQVAAFEKGPVHLIVDHPEYNDEVAITGPTRVSLLADLTLS